MSYFFQASIFLSHCWRHGHMHSCWESRNGTQRYLKFHLCFIFDVIIYFTLTTYVFLFVRTTYNVSIHCFFMIMVISMMKMKIIMIIMIKIIKLMSVNRSCQEITQHSRLSWYTPCQWLTVCDLHSEKEARRLVLALYQKSSSKSLSLCHGTPIGRAVTAAMWSTTIHNKNITYVRWSSI